MAKREAAMLAASSKNFMAASVAKINFQEMLFAYYTYTKNLDSSSHFLILTGK